MGSVRLVGRSDWPDGRAGASIDALGGSDWLSGWDEMGEPDGMRWMGTGSVRKGLLIGRLGLITEVPPPCH